MPNQLSKTSNPNLNTLEQAAGFPPFTRGYKSTALKIKFISGFGTINLFEINNDISLIKLFKEIISKKIKGDIHLKIHKAELAPILRTLLALINQITFNKAAYSKFIFYNELSKIELNDINSLKAFQINYVKVQDLNIATFLLKQTNNFPVDPFYGSNDYQNFIEKHTLKYWNEIHTMLA